MPVPEPELVPVWVPVLVSMPVPVLVSVSVPVLVPVPVLHVVLVPVPVPDKSSWKTPLNLIDFCIFHYYSTWGI